MTNDEMRLALLNYRWWWTQFYNSDGMVQQPDGTPMICNNGSGGFIPTDINMEVFELLEGGHVDQMWGETNEAAKWLSDLGIEVEWLPIPGNRIYLKEKR